MPSQRGFVFCIVVGLIVFFFSFKYSFFFSSFLVKTSVVNLDSLAFYFVFLSLILFLFVFFVESGGTAVFFLLHVMLMLVLIFFFVSVQSIYFYIFFESSFIFMFLIIMLWGGNPERIEALKYFIIYSLVGSLPLLGSIIIRGDKLGSMGMLAWKWAHFLSDVSFHIRDNTDYLNIIDRVWFVKDKEYVDKSVSGFFYGLAITHFFWVMVFLFKFPVFGLHL